VSSSEIGQWLKGFSKGKQP